MRNTLTGVAVAGAVAGLFAAGIPSADADTFTLRMASGHPDSRTPGFYVTEMTSFFAPEVKRRVAERTDHEIEFVEAYGGAIVRVAETLEGVQNRVIDIGGFCTCFEPSRLFLHNFQMYLPFGPQDSAQSLQAARMTYDEVDFLPDTFETEYSQHLLGLAAFDSYHIGTRRPWQELEDLRGVRIAGAGPNLKWIEYAGAVPVQSSMAEAYQALQTGVYDGWIMFPSLYHGFKLHEHAPYYTLIGFGAKIIHPLTINSAALARLPEEVQEILFEVGREYEERTGRILSENAHVPLEKLKEDGATIRELPAEVRAAWAESLRDWPNEMAQDANGRGLPGTEVLRTAIDNSEKAGHTWPVRYEIQ